MTASFPAGDGDGDGDAASDGGLQLHKDTIAIVETIKGKRRRYDMVHLTTQEGNSRLQAPNSK